MKVARIATLIGAGLAIAGVVAGLWIGWMMSQSPVQSPMLDAGPYSSWELFGFPVGQVISATSAITGAGLVLMWLPRLRRR